MRLARRTLLFLPAALSARAASPIRIGTLRFGSLAWELDIVRAHRLAPDVALETVEFAAGPASQVALQAGAVDLLLQDWLWVSRQRASGADLTFVPATAALGGVLVPAASPARGLADLQGKRLGIASGPVDKSWLLLRAYARAHLGLDLDRAVEKTFAPPPLLAQQLELGRLDAVLTYWPFAARGEAHGQRTLLSVSEAVEALGFPPGLPMLGAVFSERWAAPNREPLGTLLAALAQARAILAGSDAEWQRIAPLTGSANDAELSRLAAWYRSGLPGPWDAARRAEAARLYDLLAATGGPDLVGPATHLADGTFWAAG